MKAISAVVLAVLILLGVIASLEMSGGPLQDTAGIVESVGTAPDAHTGASQRVASVVLSNGKRVQAKIVANDDVHSGQEVNLRVSRNVPSGEWLFEVDVAKAKQVVK